MAKRLLPLGLAAWSLLSVSVAGSVSAINAEAHEYDSQTVWLIALLTEGQELPKTCIPAGRVMM